MKCNPWRWIWGLLPVVGLSWVAVQVEHAKIESDLATRGKAALAQAGLSWADLSFTGRDGTLSGQAVEEGDQGKAARAALATWGVRLVNNSTGLIDKVDSYRWSAMRRDNGIRLTGLVPNEKTRRDVVGIVKASFPTLEIDDRLRLARGAPPIDTWLGGVGFGIKQLAHLKHGQVDLRVTDLVLSGEATDVQSYRAVKQALARGLPPGIGLKSDRVTAPIVKPYRWSARRTGDELIVSGYTAGEKTRESIAATARAENARLHVADETQPGEGAPRGWTNAVLAVVRVLAGLEEGTAEALDATLTVSGVAATNEKAEAARNALRGLPKAFKVSANVRAREPSAPVIRPYTSGALLERGVLTLSGHVPSDGARKLVLGFSGERFQGTQIRDQLQLGAGQPDAWEACFKAGLAGLARAGTGRLDLTDRALDLVATVATDDVARTLPDEVRAAAAGGCETRVQVSLAVPAEPTLKWSAAYDGAELVLAGQVAGEQAHAAILERSRQLFAGARVSDRMLVSAEHSAKWTEAAQSGLAFLSRLQRGEVSLANRELSVSGEIGDPAVQTAIRSQLARVLPDGYVGHETIALVRPPAKATPEPQQPTAAILPKLSPEEEKRKARAESCQRALETVAQAGTIRFDRASARLHPASFATLKRLARAANTCAELRLEIAGHADADGRPRENQLLSEHRARAVAAYLAHAGVRPERMQAIGFGETQPLAPNDTARNKAKNRRIEFIVRTD